MSLSKEDGEKLVEEAKAVFEAALVISHDNQQMERMRKVLEDPSFIICMLRMRSIGLNPPTDPESSLMVMCVIQALYDKVDGKKVDHTVSNKLLNDALGDEWKL